MTAQPHDASAGTWVSVSYGLRLMSTLSALADHPVVHQPLRLPADACAVIGWGLKAGGARAAAYAAKVGLPYVALEDGFLRSVGLGDRDPPLSMSVDPVGVYYDAGAPSRLEQQIAAPHSEAQRSRASALATRWREARVSKYNHARERAAPLAGPFVLAVDQTFGDMSIQLGRASAASFVRMVEAALDENPGLPVVLKVHPDVVAGRKRAHVPALSAGAAARVTLLADNAHPPGLLEAAHSVYVVTSQMGFEALIWGKPVRTFGMPFYAGWGLTGDELAPPGRRRGRQPVTLPDLVHAALVEYPRYVDPETLARCEVERLLDWMGLQRRMRERFPARVQAVAFSSWRKPIAQVFMAGSTLQFVAAAAPLADAGARAVWGRPPDGPSPAQADDAALLRLEDGLLRPDGVGARRVRPLSWVIDAVGMYYDASAPSALEEMLQAGGFDATLLQRAAALRQAIVAAGITRYNVGAGRWQRPAGARRVVLVPGQVEDDASIAYGAPGVKRNLDLLRAVRAARPDDHLVYKPHPDVVAGKRLRGEDEDEARRWCDEIVVDIPMHALFDQVDELHVLTSLAGFEALLRGKPVVCHGSPFYAGWGLTEDTQPHPRRTRRLTLDELVAGALILYPTYVSRSSGAFTTPERALHELANWEASAPPLEPRAIRALRRLKRWRDRWRRP